MRPHKISRIGEYLRVADAITPELLAHAGVMAQGLEPAAQRLLQELHKVGDRAARDRLQEGEKSARRMSFQINIRRPLRKLSPRQAIHYLGRISMALPVLAERAAEEMATPDARELAERLETVAKRLREWQ